VFDFSRRVGALPEGRQSPRHTWQKVFDAIFLGAAMQMPSLLQIEAECRSGAWAKRIGPIGNRLAIGTGVPRGGLSGELLPMIVAAANSVRTHSSFLWALARADH
jgi:hypothetical protein